MATQGRADRKALKSTMKSALTPSLGLDTVYMAVIQILSHLFFIPMFSFIRVFAE